MVILYNIGINFKPDWLPFLILSTTFFLMIISTLRLKRIAGVENKPVDYKPAFKPKKIRFGP